MTARVAAGRRSRIAIVEDHLLQRSLARNIIDSTSDMRVVYAGEDLPGFARWWATAKSTLKPDLLLLDLRVDRGEPAQPATVRSLIRAGLKVSLFSALESQSQVGRMVEVGVSGIIGKQDPVESILAAVRAMLRGEEWMTEEVATVVAQSRSRLRLGDQEERALMLYASGLTLNAVAESIGVQPGTARKYLQRVKDKYRAIGVSISTKLEFRQVALARGLTLRARGAVADRSNRSGDRVNLAEAGAGESARPNSAAGSRRAG